MRAPVLQVSVICGDLTLNYNEADSVYRDPHNNGINLMHQWGNELRVALICEVSLLTLTVNHIYLCKPLGFRFIVIIHFYIVMF